MRKCDGMGEADGLAGRIKPARVVLSRRSAECRELSVSFQSRQASPTAARAAPVAGLHQRDREHARHDLLRQKECEALVQRLDGFADILTSAPLLRKQSDFAMLARAPHAARLDAG